MPPYPKPEKRGKKPPKPLNRGSKSLKRTPLSKKPTDRLKEDWDLDWEVGREIWNSRRHECLECGCLLRGDLKKEWLSHLHTKARRPDLRHNPANIVLHCSDCHHRWEFGNRKIMTITMQLFDAVAVQYPDNQFGRR